MNPPAIFVRPKWGLKDGCIFILNILFILLKCFYSLYPEED